MRLEDSDTCVTSAASWGSSSVTVSRRWTSTTTWIGRPVSGWCRPAGSDLSALFARIRAAIRPGGCFILYDAMSVGPAGGPVARLASRFRERHLRRAIASGIATQEEIELRRDYKRGMKAAGKDVDTSTTRRG